MLEELSRPVDELKKQILVRHSIFVIDEEGLECYYLYSNYFVAHSVH